MGSGSGWFILQGHLWACAVGNNCKSKVVKRRAGPCETRIEGRGISAGARVEWRLQSQQPWRPWSQGNLKSAVCSGAKCQPVLSLASEVHGGNVLETILAKGGYLEESRRERFEFNFNGTSFVFPTLVRPGRHPHYIWNKQLLWSQKLGLF